MGCTEANIEIYNLNKILLICLAGCMSESELSFNAEIISQVGFRLCVASMRRKNELLWMNLHLTGYMRFRIYTPELNTMTGKIKAHLNQILVLDVV